MKRKIISVLLSTILIITAIAPALTVADAAVWSGTRTVPSFSGGEYQIASGENLAWFANAVNTGSTSIRGRLTADIQLNYSGSNIRQWTPIGTEAHPFEGSLDGDGHTISGMYVNADYYCAGLFGYVAYPDDGPQEDVSPEYIVGTKTFNITNINVVDSSVNGQQNVGGIVGYARNAGILGCSYSGEVNGSENSVGGIVGWAYADTVVSECHSSGTVSGHQRVGGTAGFCSGNSVVIKCFGDTSVSGYMNVGGVVGTLSAASLRGCFFLGSVSADDRAAGLVGYSAFGDMMGAYTISTVTNSGNGTEFGGAVGTVYGGSYASIYYSYETAGFDDTKGLGRTAQEIQAHDFVKEINRSSPFFCFDYTNINNGYPVLTWQLQLDVWTGDRTMPQRNSSGTYLISKPSELAWFAGLVNGTLSGFAQNSAADAAVTDDLLMNINVYDDTMGVIPWTPIGTAESPYTGTFSGGGYNIAGIYVEAADGAPNTNAGLFGYVGTGAINNVVVIDGLICGKENVGGIAGFLSGGSAFNCFCDSEIRGDRAVGGIVGNLGSQSSSLTNCCMIGTITGTNISGEPSFLQNVGGIIGYSNKGTVTRCFTSADINAPSARFVGGIMGNNSSGSVTSSYSTSTVKGNVNVGGLIGYNNNGTVTKCYTAGKITGTSQANMAFGTTSGSGVSYCYFDESFKGLSNGAAGATAKTPAQMTGSSSVTSLGLGSEFKSTADDVYFYYYPQLNVLANSSLSAIRNASVESVKRVQNRFIARVEIDGRRDTYYENLGAAVNYASNTASTVTPTIFLVRDYELTSTLNLGSSVSLFGENGAVLSRASTLTNAMINVTGDAEIGSSLYGDDDETQFYIDGANIPGAQSAITVAGGVTLRISEGVEIRNCRTESTSVRGAALSTAGGTVNMNGGKFNANTSKTVAGAVYIQQGTLTMSGGSMTGNSGTQGGAIYNNDGTVVISGGTLSGNSASGQMLGGGAVSGYGVYSVTTISGKAILTGNSAEEGGAVCVRYYGTVRIDGGSIKENTAFLKGGALFIEDGSEAYITGGLIENNIAQHPSDSTKPAYGAGIYCEGDLYMSGSAQLDPHDDIYLVTGRYITVSERLSCPGNAATITPQSYTEGMKVLGGSELLSVYNKFGLSDNSWRILASGKLTSLATANVAILSKEHAYSIEFTNLAEAFAAVGDGETANITVIADNTVNSVIPVHGDVTLTCDDNTCVTMRGGSFYGVMFDVQKNSVLRLGDKMLNSTKQAQNDYLNSTESEGQIIIDGGYLNNGVVGAAAVNVAAGGQFYMYDDAIIRNCKNTTTSVVTLSGTMHMYGGTISGNSSCYGGAIYVRTSTAVLNLYGGVIAGNTSEKGGDAIYALGKVYRNIHSYNYYYIAPIYDEAGEIIGLEDPAFAGSVKTDILIGEGETVYLNSNTVYTAETEESIYIREIETAPPAETFIPNTMLLALKSYTSGYQAVSGTNIAGCYASFALNELGYYIQSSGKIGVNKILLRTTSSYQIDRDKAVISGFDITNTTVSKITSSLLNSSTYIIVSRADGWGMRSTEKVTTGCRIRLFDSSDHVIDELTIVVYGDINADMVIDGQDAVLVRAVSAGMLNSGNANAGQLEAADVNLDGAVTDIDADSVEACGLFLNTIEQIH